MNFLFDALDWDDENCPSTLVDVGSPQGAIRMQLLRRFPKMEKCIVQDLPGTINGATVPPDLTDRIEFSAHDFFTGQRDKEADVYFLRQILHNWPGEYALKIIRSLIPA